LTVTARACRPVRLGAELAAPGAGALRVRATVDGRPRPARLDRRSGVVRLAAVRLAPGRHTVRVRVAGRGVPAATRTWTVTVRRC
jgi:hypothetical protein